MDRYVPMWPWADRMHPAPSIIAFTVSSGLGYGLAFFLGLGLLDPTSLATKLAHLVALGLIAAGLASSTLHLGNPQRAWRALSQWRTSWLSREGVMAIATFLPLAAAAWLSLFGSRSVLAVGLAGSAMAAATVYCTAMIYASLRSVDAWHTHFTPVCYLLFAGAGGALLAAFFAAAAGHPPLWPGLAAMALLMAAWTAKRRWRERMMAMAPTSTPESATGLGPIGKVRLLERPHMTENYLTSEMGFRVARKHAEKLWRIAIVAGGVLPFLLVALALIAFRDGGAMAAFLAALAVIAHVIGMLAERWLFFAEARHAVMNYYGG